MSWLTGKTLRWLLLSAVVGTAILWISRRGEVWHIDESVDVDEGP